MAHRVSRKAEADLDDIWIYVAGESGSIEIADRLVDSITDRFFLLANHPYAGRERNDDLGPGRRSFPVGEHLIIYRIDGGVTC
jgi:toxin ParE1/3/4